jgi:hypothetical protein
MLKISWYIQYYYEGSDLEADPERILSVLQRFAGRLECLNPAGVFLKKEMQRFSQSQIIYNIRRLYSTVQFLTYVARFTVHSCTVGH